MDCCSVSKLKPRKLSVTPGMDALAHPAPPSMGFHGKTHWSGLPFPSLVYGYIHIYVQRYTDI